MNKGTDSLGVLDFAADLKEHYPNAVNFLMGNHDWQWFQALAYRDPSAEESIENSNFPGILKTIDQATKMRYVHFFMKMNHYIELENDFIVHAGFLFKKENCFLDYESMMQIRDFPYDSQKAKGKRIIHGHNPKPLGFISESIKKRCPVLALDNACVEKEKESFGNLLCFEIDSNTLWVQKNIE